MTKDEEMIKKNSDECNVIKAKLSAFARKDVGNYMQRDFFDDIYKSKVIKKEHFVQGMLEGFESA